MDGEDIGAVAEPCCAETESTANIMNDIIRIKLFISFTQKERLRLDKFIHQVNVTPGAEGI